MSGIYCPICISDNVIQYYLIKNCNHVICSNCRPKYIRHFNVCSLCNQVIISYEYKSYLVNFNDRVIVPKGENKQMTSTELNIFNSRLNINNINLLNNIDLINNNNYIINFQNNGGNILIGKFLEYNILNNKYKFDDITVFRRYDHFTYPASPSCREYNLTTNDIIYEY